MAVAQDGERAEPRLPAPSGLRTVLGFSRLSSAAYAIIRRAVDEDPEFRTRVAAAAAEAEVGRAGWLWLQRPDGWEADPAFTAVEDDHDRGRGMARLRRERDGAEAAAARHHQAAADADAARQRAEAQLAGAVERGRDEAAGELVAQRAELHRLGDERNQAMRTQKRSEADLAATRRDLKAARAALVSAEADLAAARRGRPAPLAPRSGDAPSTVDGSRQPGASTSSADRPGRGATLDLDEEHDGADRLDRRAAQSAIDAAARAAAQLARALADAAAVLGPGPGPSGPLPVGRVDDPAWPPSGVASVADRSGARGRGGRSGRGPQAATGRLDRVRPKLPPGLFDGSPEAHRHLLTSGDSLLVVDGYNVARAAWEGLEPEEERRRTVALLEEVRARSGGSVVVVFDGADDMVAPTASRAIRVQFSASGVTADEAIAELLGAVPADQPVVVVSSDREVADDARRQGAVSVGARQFLTAAGR